MIVLETSFLIDYLDGVDAAGTFLEEHPDQPFFASTLSLFEIYRGGARIGGRDRLNGLTDALDWIVPVPFTEETAREAAIVEAELLEDGSPINLGDVLIAGVCRSHGGQLVTRDAHFDQVNELDVRSY